MGVPFIMVLKLCWNNFKDLVISPLCSYSDADCSLIEWWLVPTALVSRQFVEMTKSRIEGLLAAFPKLMSSGRTAQQQHTFVETDTVRYVYQPLDKIYVLLITTTASNILEDLETLRLFARVVPEYCRSLEEMEIRENAFNLIFAFDEIVALGYRENVNLAQIKTFVEMDSHEEKVYQAVRQVLALTFLFTFLVQFFFQLLSILFFNFLSEKRSKSKSVYFLIAISISHYLK